MITVAIIGAGNIAQSHIKAYLEFPQRCRITWLSDIYPENAEKLNANYELEAQICKSYKDIIANNDIDLVSICTPPFTHAEIAVDFLNAGKNVIVEKPMAASLEECDAMIAAAEKSNRILSVIAQNRFRDPVANLKKILDTGIIGRVVHAQVDSLWWRGHEYYDLWWRGTWEKEGGGCTLNHAVHHIDMLAWMLGMPQKVSAVISNAAHDNAEIEDISVAILQYGESKACARGALAQITSSVIHHGEEQQLIFQGERARLSSPWRVEANIGSSNGFPKKEKNTELISQIDNIYNSLPKLAYTAHAGQIDNVLCAIETGAGVLITGEDGRRTIELISAIYKAGCEQKTVELPIQRGDPFYTVKGIMNQAPRFYKKPK